MKCKIVYQFFIFPIHQYLQASPVMLPVEEGTILINFSADMGITYQFIG